MIIGCKSAGNIAAHFDVYSYWMEILEGVTIRLSIYAYYWVSSRIVGGHGRWSSELL